MKQKYINSKQKLIGKLKEMGAKDLTDNTIEKAFKGVVAQRYCVNATKYLRDNNLITIEDLK